MIGWLEIPFKFVFFSTQISPLDLTMDQKVNVGAEMLQITRSVGSTEKTDVIMQARSGDIVHAQHPGIYGVNLKPDQIIPINTFNAQTSLLTAWENEWYGEPQGKIDILEEFHFDWTRGYIEPDGKCNTSFKQQQEGRIWQKNYIDGILMKFKPAWWNLWPDTFLKYNPVDSAVSQFDGPSPGNQFHLPLDDVDPDVRYAKSRRMHDHPKNYIPMGETDVFNPITKFWMHDWNWDLKSKTVKIPLKRKHKPVYYGGWLCVYAIKHPLGFVTLEYVSEQNPGDLYLLSNNPMFKDYQRIGYIREYRGGYAYNYTEDFVRNVLIGHPDINDSSVQIEKFLSPNKQIKINFYPE